MTTAVTAIDSVILGVLGMALPVIAHLMNRRTRQWVMFPSIQLLRRATAQQSKLFQLRKWIVLALRCLAVGLIAAAFARPVWTAADATADPSAAEALVLVIDVSASTAQQRDGVAAMHLIRAAAEDQIDALKPGRDLVAFVVADANPHAPFTRPAPNLSAVRAELQSLAPTSQRADLQGAIALAATMLAEHEGRGRLVIISDMQQTNWADVLIDQTLLGAEQRTRVEIVPLASDAPPANLSLARPRVRPSQPIAGRPTRLGVDVHNYSEAPQTVVVTASIDGTPIATRNVSVPSWSQQTAFFDTTFASARPYGLAFSITPDTLPVDDRAYLGVSVVDRIPVAVISDDDDDTPTGAAYFLARALAPSRDDDNDLEVRRLRSSQVTASSLAGVPAVGLSEAGPLPASAVTALRDHVADGGGLVFLCGAGPVARNAAALQQASDNAMLPWQPIERRDARTTDDPRVADRRAFSFDGAAAWATPPLASFDALSQDALLRVRLDRVYSVGDTSDEAHTLLRLDDTARTPALTLHSYKAGRVLMANFSPNPRHGDLAKHGVYVALMNGMVDVARSARLGRRTPSVGSPLTLTLDTTDADTRDSRPRLTAPDDATLEPMIARDATGVSMTVARTKLPGLYRLSADDRTLAVAAANVDERESDLRTLPLDQIDNRVTGIGAEVHVEGSVADGSGRRVTRRDGSPLWHWLLVAACVALAIEMLLICVWRR